MNVLQLNHKLGTLDPHAEVVIDGKPVLRVVAVHSEVRLYSTPDPFDKTNWLDWKPDRHDHQQVCCVCGKDIPPRAVHMTDYEEPKSYTHMHCFETQVQERAH